MANNMQNYRVFFVVVPACIAAIVLSACDPSGLGGGPTPEPWSPPQATAAQPTMVATTVSGTMPTVQTVAPTVTPLATPAPTTYTVQRGTVVNTLDLAGAVVPVAQQDLAFSQTGAVRVLNVALEESFKKGQILAELDLGDFPGQLRQAQADYAQQQAAIKQGTVEQQLPVRRAQLDLESAKAKLATLQGPPDATDIAKARAVVTQAQATLAKTRNDASAVKTQAEQQLKQAQKKLIEAQAAFAAASQRAEGSKENTDQQQLAQAFDALHAAEDEVAKRQIDYDTARGNEIAAVQGAEADVTIAQANLDRLLKGPSTIELIDARRAVDIAQVAVDEARQRVKPDPQLIKALELADQTIQSIQNQIAERRLIAPFDGQVVKINVGPGDTVQANQPFMTVLDPAIDPAALEIRVEGTADTNNTPDANPVQVSAGQAAEISFAGHRNKTFPGQVTKVVSTVTGDGANAVTTRVYHLSFEAPGLQFKPGDQSRVTIVLSRRDDTLWLPSDAIRFDPDPYVLSQKSGSPERLRVTTGIRSADRVEILEGLDQGDVVLAWQ